MRQLQKVKIRKILIIRTDRMGDALLNIPAIRALKQTFGSSVTALINPALKDLLLGVPELDQILPFDEERWNRNIFARLSLLRQIRRMRFDLAVVLNPAKRFHILTYLAGIPYRLGYNRKWGFLLTHKIEDRKSLGQKHEVEYNLDLVRSIGADTKDKSISLQIKAKDKQFVGNLLLKHDIKDNDLLIAIHPHSSNPDKCWPQEAFAVVAEKLHSKFSAAMVVVGGSEETVKSAELVALTKCPVVDLTGQLTLRQLAAFFQRCSLLISNDSGPVHIAAASATPCVVMFGRSNPGVGPRRWGPWGKGHIVLHKDQSLASITPEEVLQAANKQLKSSKSSKSSKSLKSFNL